MNDNSLELVWVKDNSLSSEFSKIPNLTNKIVDKPLKRLEQDGVLVFPRSLKDADDITEKQKVLEEEKKGEHHTSNVMGYIGLDNERLIIQSRFCNANNHDYFFQYLLHKVLDLPNIVDLETDSNQDNRLFNFLLFLFPHYLKTALRKGLFKTYICRQYNDGNIKGTIDIARHIKRNTPFIGNIAYNQRELSYDNSLTELVRHTIEFIKGKSYALLASVKDEVNLVINATQRYKVHDRQKIIAENQKNPVRHAYFREYRDLQRLCILILRHQKHQIGSGTQKIYGILFDGSWLWEEYVYTLVSKDFHHPMNKSKKGVQYLFDGDIGPIYPDFISKSNENRIIADAKYKPIGNISGKDYQQVLAYMFRFDAKTGFYFYPEANEEKEKMLLMNRGSTYENNVEPRNDIRIIKLGLKIPANASDYNDFVGKIGNSEEEFKNEFNTRVQAC